MRKPKIVIINITPLPQKILDVVPKILVEFSDGSTKHMFTYHPDKIVLETHGFIGLTEEEVCVLFRDEDVKHLHS